MESLHRVIGLHFLRLLQDLEWQFPTQVGRLATAPIIPKPDVYRDEAPTALRQLTPFSRIRGAPESRRSFGEAARSVLAGCERREGVVSRR
jgi:hypothetical protein